MVVLEEGEGARLVRGLRMEDSDGTGSGSGR
jgi:hypothetical protein